MDDSERDWPDRDKDDPLRGLFGDDAPRARRVSRCACCGSPAEYRVQVQVARVNRAAKNIQGQMRSQSVRVCAGCAADSFTRAVAAAGNVAALGNMLDGESLGGETLGTPTVGRTNVSGADRLGGKKLGGKRLARATIGLTNDWSPQRLGSPTIGRANDWADQRLALALPC